MENLANEELWCGCKRTVGLLPNGAVAMFMMPFQAHAMRDVRTEFRRSCFTIYVRGNGERIKAVHELASVVAMAVSPFVPLAASSSCCRKTLTKLEMRAMKRMDFKHTGATHSMQASVPTCVSDILSSKKRDAQLNLLGCLGIQSGEGVTSLSAVVPDNVAVSD
jgi:hypothetical protein